MNSNGLLPIVELSGSPYEIGFTHGSRAKEHIENSIKTYSAMFRDCVLQRKSEPVL